MTEGPVWLSHLVTSWPLGMNAEGHVLKHEVTSLSVRPLLFHPCLTILLSPSLILSRAAAIASSVYSSYSMTYTWRVCSLFIFGTPTARVQLSAVCITSATVSSLTFSSSRTHRRSRCVHSNLGASGSPMEVKRTDKAGPVFSHLTISAVFICVNAFVYVCVCANLYVKGK